MLLAGCASGLLPADDRTFTPPVISGRIAFPESRQAQATPAEVGTAATVSLIDPKTNVTMATTLSTPERKFILKTSSLSPESRTYYLEAIKGLRSNVAGNDAARLRTLIKWVSPGTGWQSISYIDASISPVTTALSAIVSLKATSSTAVDPDALLGTLDPGPPAVFNDAGTGITQDELATVTGLVNSALDADRDPLSSITWDGTSFKPKTGPLGPPPFVSDVSPVPLAGGQAMTITGGNFQATLASNSVTIGGVPATLATGTTTLLRGTVPGGARSGSLVVLTLTGAATFDVTVLQDVPGGINQPGPLPVSGAGKDVTGGVFSRFFQLWQEFR